MSHAATLEQVVAQSLMLDFSGLASEREVVVVALKGETEDAFDLLDTYRQSAGEVVDQSSSVGSARRHVGLLVHIATIWRDAGHLDRFQDELDEALRYADKLEDAELVKSIRAGMQAGVEG